MLPHLASACAFLQVCLTRATITWALFSLAKHPECQAKLREELCNVSSTSLSYDALNDLKYLDAVVRETIRLYPAFSGTLRVAARDSVIPLSQPMRMKDGTLTKEIVCVGP